MKNKAERAAAFNAGEIYLVISSEFTMGRPVPEIFEAAAASGIKIIQLREKHKGAKFLYETALACRPIADRYNVLMIIDDCVDVAVAANADGVHLGQTDLPIDAARRVAPELWYGISTHNMQEALAAKAAGADYINIGPIYPTATKETGCDALGPEAISNIAPVVNMPFSVMGGIKQHRFRELLSSGAEVLAMVTEITTAPDVEARCRELLSEYRKYRNVGQ